MMEEIDDNRFASKPADQGTAIEFRDARFAWDSINRTADSQRPKKSLTNGWSTRQQNGNNQQMKKASSDGPQSNGEHTCRYNNNIILFVIKVQPNVLCLDVQ